MNTVNVKTRSGRVSKVPTRMKPTEDVCDDDFDDDEYDTDYEISDDDLCETETESESEDECDDSDEDENGNLKGFVVDDTDEESEA